MSQFHPKGGEKLARFLLVYQFITSFYRLNIKFYHIWTVRGWTWGDVLRNGDGNWVIFTFQLSSHHLNVLHPLHHLTFPLFELGNFSLDKRKHGRVSYRLELVTRLLRPQAEAEEGQKRQHHARHPDKHQQVHGDVLNDRQYVERQLKDDVQFDCELLDGLKSRQINICAIK